MRSRVNAIDAQRVVKTYVSGLGPVEAVRGISLTIPRGTLFGFLGPNGAGKTTFMKMIHAAFPPTGGTLHVLGQDVNANAPEIKQRLGVASQEDNLDPDFDVEGNLVSHAQYFGIPRGAAKRKARELLDFVGLREKARENTHYLSGGMKRRLILARSLVNDPDMVVLDEPTTGLDPQARHLVWEKVRQLRASGRTVLLTTHYMDEAERLCDDLVVIDGGRVLDRASPASLIARHSTREVLEASFGQDGDRFVGRLRALVGTEGRCEAVGERVLIYHDHASQLREAVARAFPDAHILTRRSSLEDVFLHLTGRALRE